MKTLNCTQCGAAIERIPVNARSGRCDYCKASFLLPEEKRPVVAGLSFGVITASDPDDDGTEFGPLAMAVLVAVLLAIIVFAGVKTQEQLRARDEASRVEEAKQARLRNENKITNVPVAVIFESGPNDVVRYELPVIDTTAFAVARRIDGAAGANLVVVVRVKTDRAGNVIDAEAVSGSVMLRQPAVKAAGTTVFSAGTGKKVRTITYTFG